MPIGKIEQVTSLCEMCFYLCVLRHFNTFKSSRSHCDVESGNFAMVDVAMAMRRLMSL